MLALVMKLLCRPDTLPAESKVLHLKGDDANSRDAESRSI